MEENISLDELTVILEAYRKQQYQQNKFLAALKGIDIEAGAAEDKVEEIKRKIRAESLGINEDDLEIMEAGFGIESDDED